MKVGDIVVWVYDKKPHEDFGKTFTIEYIVPTVKENGKKYSPKWFVPEVTYKSKLFNILK